MKNINLNKELILNEVRKITKDMFKEENLDWTDKDTLICWKIDWSEDVKNIFKDIIENDEVVFQFEYWKDESLIKYLLCFEDETICINELIQCEYLDNLIMEIVRDYE